MHFRDADRRAEARRLHEHGVAERVLDRIAEPDRVVARNGDAAVAQHLLEQVLVHRQRRRRDPRADIGDAGQLEQALHRPVLPERPVQDRQHDVDGAERRERPTLRGNRQRLHGAACNRLLQASGLERPPAVAADGDVHDLVALGIERLQHRARREQRDVVLARAAAREQGDAEPAAHGVVVVVSVPDTSCPTVSVTTVFAGCCEPPCGDWLSTTPSAVGSVTC